MKKYILLLIPIFTTLFFITGCDFVNNANPDVAPATTTTTGGSNVIMTKAFVEDYTGHKCGNCPEAAIVLKNLESQYPGKIIPVAIHAGSFANTNATFPTSFTTTAGNDYNTFFGVSAQGNPNGMINRIGYTSGASVLVKSHTLWGTEVAQIINTPAKFQIKISNSYNAGSSSVTTSVTVKSLANNVGTYKLVVLLTEDSIVAEQLDYSLPVGSQTNLNYEFNHVLRGAINSSWGDPVLTTSANLNDSVVKVYSNFSINALYRPRKCHVVAYLYNAAVGNATEYEILQAEEELVTP